METLKEVENTEGVVQLCEYHLFSFLIMKSANSRVFLFFIPKNSQHK